MTALEPLHTPINKEISVTRTDFFSYEGRYYRLINTLTDLLNEAYYAKDINLSNMIQSTIVEATRFTELQELGEQHFIELQLYLTEFRTLKHQLVFFSSENAQISPQEKYLTLLTIAKDAFKLSDERAYLVNNVSNEGKYSTNKIILDDLHTTETIINKKLQEGFVITDEQYEILATSVLTKVKKLFELEHTDREKDFSINSFLYSIRKNNAAQKSSDLIEDDIEDTQEEDIQKVEVATQKEEHPHFDFASLMKKDLNLCEHFKRSPETGEIVKSFTECSGASPSFLEEM